MKDCRLMQVWSFFFFFSSRRRHTRLQGDWSSDVCSSDLLAVERQRVVGDRHPLSLYGEVGRFAAQLGPAAFGGAMIGQIGRAACRGRVEISVGAGSLKKKKKKREVAPMSKRSKEQPNIVR